MVSILCLKKQISTGNYNYPVFIGFATPTEILQVASVPSFSAMTNHSEIASNILTTPVRDWQRPLNENRVIEIANTFNNPSELMPNPVLICENMLASSGQIQIAQQNLSGIPANIWEIKVSLPINSNSKPMWILDGQHRIYGLSQSLQSTNPIPVVLLLNHDSQVYAGKFVAKLFAQVTTAAKPLDVLHNEWLTFAFKLQSYAQSNPNGQDNLNAMETVSELCRNQTFHNVPNPFFNKIQFNMFDANAINCRPQAGGFHYNCLELKEVIRRFYYNSSSSHGMHLPPLQLAEQLANAFIALTKSVALPHDSTVFFGSPKYEQKIIQDAFWVGVLSSILARGPYNIVDWESLFQKLKFPVTDWNFNNWYKSLSGPVGAISKRLVINVFADAFRNQNLPTSTGTMADYLKGNDAKIILEFSLLTASGNVSRSGKTDMTLVSGNRLSMNISPARHVKVRYKSGNIGKLEIIDTQHPPGSVITYPENGFKLYNIKQPLKLLLRMQHYGGSEGKAWVDLTW